MQIENIHSTCIYPIQKRFQTSLDERSFEVLTICEKTRTQWKTLLDKIFRKFVINHNIDYIFIIFDMNVTYGQNETTIKESNIFIVSSATKLVSDKTRVTKRPPREV